MSRKPETTLITGVHRQWDKVNRPHIEKQHNPYRSGTADVWYSGRKADMWIEYKWVAKLPKVLDARKLLSAQQLDWLLRRSAEGRSVGVVVGCPEGVIRFINDDWAIPLHQPADHLQTRAMLAKIILEWTGAQCPSPSISSTRPKSFKRRTASSSRRCSSRRS